MAQLLTFIHKGGGGFFLLQAALALPMTSWACMESEAMLSLYGLTEADVQIVWHCLVVLVSLPIIILALY